MWIDVNWMCESLWIHNNVREKFNYEKFENQKGRQCSRVGLFFRNVF